MPFTARMYARAEDRDRITRFLSDASAGEPAPGYWHVGDVIWAMYLNTTFEPHKYVRLWEDAATGALLGISWIETGDGAGEIETMLSPAVRATEEGVAIVAEAMAWFRRIAARRGLTTLRARARDTDAWQVGVLATHGYIRDDDHIGYVHFRRPFSAATLPEAALPEGFSVRAVGGPDEWQRRIDLHRAVWRPSRVTLEAYSRLRSAPYYRPDLDLVAVAPNGDFAAYCIIWYDERTRVGEYEPVGAHPEWRRQGVTRAVLIEGLRRLRALGAERAIVLTGENNAPAIRLYESCGFVIHDHERYYHYQSALV